MEYGNLCLERRENETIHIGPDIVVTVAKLCGNKVKLRVTAPVEINILRGELLPDGGFQNGQGIELGKGDAA